MSIEEIVEVEKNGIINTINEYTRENFIVNYLNVFKELSYPNDKDKLAMIAHRLLDWYDINFEDIMNNEFVKNKHEHQKCILILRELECGLKI